MDGWIDVLWVRCYSLLMALLESADAPVPFPFPAARLALSFWSARFCAWHECSGLMWPSLVVKMREGRVDKVHVQHTRIVLMCHLRGLLQLHLDGWMYLCMFGATG